MKRRRFIQSGLSASLASSALPVFSQNSTSDLFEKSVDERNFLKEILYTREEVDSWLAGEAFPFSKYHPKFGWLLPNAYFQDGIDNSWSVYTYEGDDGPRLMSNHASKPCRINTYGNSFTQCHQVSDHETWQEVLAAHIQEPVRNYGIGGWSVYQAYLRMVFEESRNPADYLILNIYEDDHKRNLDSWRNIRVRKHPQHIESPLPYVKVDIAANRISEHGNPCPTPESLYDLCDLDKAHGLFADDFVLNVMISHQKAKEKQEESGYDYLQKLIKTHGIETKLDKSKTLDAAADEVHRQASLFSTIKIVEKVESFAKEHGKEVLYVLSFPGKSVARYIVEGKRSDLEFLSFLQEKDLPYIDLLSAHAGDFKEHNLNIERYIDKYYIGHYTPLGNFFCAHQIRDRVVKMLDPKPRPYE